MTANEIPVGAGFIGSIWLSDWRDHWKAGKPIPGDLVRVSLIKPVASRGDTHLKELLKLHANHLHTDSASQLSSGGLSFWVAGVRESRSAKVYVFDWQNRAPKTHLERIHSLLKDGSALGVELVLAELEHLEGMEVPYL